MIIQGNSGKACSLKIFFLLISCMYNLFRCKNEDGSSIAKKNALRRLKRSLNSNEMTKRFSGHQQNVSIVSSGLPRCKDFVLVERRGGGGGGGGSTSTAYIMSSFHKFIVFCPKPPLYEGCYMQIICGRP